MSGCLEEGMFLDAANQTTFARPEDSSGIGSSPQWRVPHHNTNTAALKRCANEDDK